MQAVTGSAVHQPILPSSVELDFDTGEESELLPEELSKETEGSLFFR